MDSQKDCATGRKRGAVAREVAGGQATPCGVFASGSQRQEKDTLKAVEKEWRMLFNEELANLELDFCISRVPTRKHLTRIVCMTRRKTNVPTFPVSPEREQVST